MSTFSDVRIYDRAEPLYLLEIGLLGIGAPVLYLAERDLLVEGIHYESYLSEVKGPEWDISSRWTDSIFEFLVMNDPWRQYSNLIEAGDDFPLEGAEITLKETCIGQDGAPLLPEVLFAGILEGPFAIDRMEFRARARGLWSLAYKA